MSRKHPALWATAVSLLLVVVALAAWQLRGVSRSAGPVGNATPTAAAGAAQAAVPANSAPPAAFFQVSPQRLQAIGVATGTVTYGPVQDTIRTVGNVAVDEATETSVQVRLAGWIEIVFANVTGERVEKGQPLFTLTSPDLYADEQDYLAAMQNRDRLAASPVGGVAPGANQLLAAATARLQQEQIPPQEIERLRRTNVASRTLTVTSPASGYITERDALPGQQVQPGARLYAIAQLSPIWVNAAIEEADTGRIRRGDPATVAVEALPGRHFEGRIDTVLPAMDPATRTATARIVLDNANAALTPGMFARVEVTVPLGAQVTVPTSGVLQTGERSLAFVDHGGGSLESREVELGPQIGERYVVLHGLRPGERIVTSANFLVDAESQLQSAIGNFAPPPPGVGQAQANQPQAQIDLTTSPSPPRPGSNVLRVRLTDASGQPITGAAVTVVFFMPAMPAMGMAAMTVTRHLGETGGGYYQGAATLGSGGTWQATLTATRQGALLARRQMSLTATGGM